MTHVLYTIGHSNRSLEEFIEILQAHNIEVLADIRSFPGSRKLPHFNSENLAEAIPAAGMEYLPWKVLGGRRKGVKDSINTGWHHPAFRGYADYMQTPDFDHGLRDLLKRATKNRYAIMCAEAVPWRCHRNLVADAAVQLHGWEARHIMTSKRYDVHKPIPFGKVVGKHLEYPADDMLAGLSDSASG